MDEILMMTNYSNFFSRSILKINGLIISLLLVDLMICGVLAAESEKQAPLDIRILNEKEWEASTKDVAKVLNSAAHELWIYFPKRKLPPINVNAKGGPITLFKRGPNGEIQIKLNTGKTYWAQYSFQFAHEMCHVLCDCKPQENPNHWFEESLCEMASIFVMRKMAVTWKTDPPYPHWKDYSKALDAYATDRIALGKVPGGKTFVQWLAENESDMRLNSTDRARNNVVAGVLLPLFEAEPAMWEAVTYLNTEKLNKLYSLKQYLEAWRRNSEEKHHAFIDKIAKLFE